MATVLSATGVTTAVTAAECPTPSYEYQPGNAVIAPSDANADTPVEATAERIVSDDQEITLEGNTRIEYLGRTLEAENAKYKTDTGEVDIEGELRFRGQGIVLDSRDARFDIDGGQFDTGESRYELDLEGRYATGDAGRVARESDGSFVLQDASYSTCPPGDKSWQIRAKEIRLDTTSGIGTADNLVLRFKGVPLLAVPTFSFPIGPERKTGFLAPIFARSDNTGLELHLPWYWNIRPNLDATFTPRLMSRRGAQLQSEFRYLNAQGIWTLDNELLRDRERDGEFRQFTQLNHAGRFGSDWRSLITASRVSDGEYFRDLGNSLELASITHLEQRAELQFERGRFSAIGRLQGFQTVDENIAQDDRPYRRLPQLKGRYVAPESPFGFRFSGDSEFVYFDRDDSVTGTRLDVRPRLSLPITRDAWFIHPSWSHRLTYYALDNVGDTGFDSNQGRSLSTFSLDGGLFFDRPLDRDGSIQTLEPRLFYLRVPFEDQRDIPLFDSSAFDFNISQLFRENRFSGGDRIADANQLSLALTTRFINGRDGREMLRASIGQILYFEDRRVDLDVVTDEDPAMLDSREVSDFVSELSAEFTEHWSGKGTIQWNPDDNETVRGALLLSYSPDDSRILNLAHRRVSTDPETATEQIDLSFLWPIGNAWRLAGRWNYAIDENVSIESLFGLEYDSCCWALRFAARRFIADEGLDHDTNLYLQLVLKGLAPLGQNYGALLENAILGYRDDYR